MVTNYKLGKCSLKFIRYLSVLFWHFGGAAE
jgi:hypothetical protein